VFVWVLGFFCYLFHALAGHTTSWTLFNIATCPEVQEKIAEELDSLGLLATPERPTPREVTLDDLKAMPYLSAAAKEAMRMLPVVSIMGR
jgi:fatty acid synthase